MQKGDTMNEQQSGRHYSAMELILAIAVLYFPLLFLQALTIFLLVGVLLILAGFIILGIFGLFQLVAGVALVGVGIEKLFSIPMGAFSVMGFGVTNIGIALLIECFVLWLFGVAIPAFIKKITGKEERHEETS